MSERTEPGCLLYTSQTLLKYVRIALNIPRYELFIYKIYTGSGSKRPRQNNNNNDNNIIIIIIIYHIILLDNIEEFLCSAD
jgi:hypothetical protein